MADQREPFVWWVKVRDVPGAPDTFYMEKSGRYWGNWDADWRGYGMRPMTDFDFRFWGFEKCYCSPLDAGTVNERCPAHASVCI